MAGFVVKNNAESLVADNPLASGATTLNVTSGEGDNFPSTFPYRLTIWDDENYADPTDDSGMEIVECTGRSGDALTIVRAKEGTSDVEHANGERVAMLITAGLFDDSVHGIITKLDGIEDGATADQTGAEIRTAYQGAISVVTKTAAYTATAGDDTILCDATSGAITVNLPTAVGISGKKYDIKKIDSTSNSVTIDPDGTETIDGETTIVIIGENDNYTIQSDGTNWRII